MRLMLRERAWNAFLQATRTFVHPEFDAIGAYRDAVDKGLLKPTEKQEESEAEHRSGGGGMPPGTIDQSSFSIPEGFRVKRPFWMYINTNVDDPRYWEIPVPMGAAIHCTAERKPEYMVSHPCDPDAFDYEDDPTGNGEN